MSSPCFRYLQSGRRPCQKFSQFSLLDNSARTYLQTKELGRKRAVNVAADAIKQARLFLRTRIQIGRNLVYEFECFVI